MPRRRPRGAGRRRRQDRRLTTTSTHPICSVYRGTREAGRLEDLGAISDVLLEPDTFVWFDLVDPHPADLGVIRDEFHLHPLAIEDALKAHQRPKIEAYGEYWFIVVHGVTQTGDSLDIHEIAIFAGAKFIVTVRSGPPYPVGEVLRRWHDRGDGLRSDSGTLLYVLLDTVVDGYSSTAEFYVDEVERLEEALFAPRQATRDVLLRIFAMKKEVQRFRRAVLPMRDILAPIMRGDVKLLASDELPYFRDVYDHALRVIDQMDAARDLVASALDIHISIASSRQNEVAKQLTIIATIFLPLTYLTGFFGQNFAYLVNHIVGPATFWSLGVGGQFVALIALLAYFKFKRWF